MWCEFVQSFQGLHDGASCVVVDPGDENWMRGDCLASHIENNILRANARTTVHRKMFVAGRSAKTCGNIYSNSFERRHSCDGVSHYIYEL